MLITDLLQDFGVPYALPGDHHHARRGWIQIECHQCSPHSQSFKLGINLQYLSCNCWQCGRFSLIDTLVEALHVTPQEAYSLAKQLREGIGFFVPYEAYTTRPRGRLLLPKGVQPMEYAHKAYLEGRGFNVEEVERLWGVQGIGISADLAWRLFIPIHVNSEIVSWTTRSLVDSGTRYINARPEQEKIPLKETLLGEDFVKHVAVIVEGPLDAIKIGPGAVCLFGVNYSKEQERRLTSIPIRYVCFDSEPNAQRRAKKLVDDLSCFPGETYNIVLDAKDPASCSDEELKQLRKLLE